jgi:hypothetical protein
VFRHDAIQKKEYKRNNYRRPKPPRIRPWTEVLASLKEEYPKEFTEKSLTIEDQLRDASINLHIEQNFIANVDPPYEGHSIDIEEKIELDMKNYRDNKRWLNED